MIYDWSSADAVSLGSIAVGQPGGEGHRGGRVPIELSDVSAATSGTGLSSPGAGTFQRADWGAGWTAWGRGMPGTPRTARTHTVIERKDVALSADPGAQANHAITASPVDGADGTVLTVQPAGHGLLRFDPDDIALSGPYVEEWCLGSCQCPDGGGPAFPADQIIGDLTISGTGTFSWSTSGRALVITGTEFSYSVGSSALSDEFLTITDDDVPTSGTTTLSGAVDDNVLTIASADGSAGRVFFPTTWIRE